MQVADGTKIYYSRIPGQRFIWADGSESFFSAGRIGVLEVKDPDKQRQLDAIIGVQQQIYVEDIIPESKDPVVDVPAATQAEVSKADAAMGTTNARVNQEPNDTKAIDTALAQSMSAATMAADSAITERIAAARARADEVRAAAAAKK